MNTPDNTSEQPTILIAEDDPTFGMLLKFRLTEEGYNPIIAKDGMEALEKINKHNPKLIVCDIMMPFVSGLEIVERVRHEMNNSVPIIIISSAGQEEMTLKAFDLGANDFLSKPFSINELIVRVNKII